MYTIQKGSDTVHPMFIAIKGDRWTPVLGRVGSSPNSYLLDNLYACFFFKMSKSSISLD